MSSTLAIVQARLGSTRFPRKALARLHGKPLFQHTLERAAQIPGIDRLILAVPWGEQAAFMNAMTDSVPECSVFAAKSVATNDVLGRFAAAAHQYPEAETIVRLTADCPLIEPSVCGRLLDYYRGIAGCEYAWLNTHSGEWPDGLDCEVFSRRLLVWSNATVTDAQDREHVTSQMRRAVQAVSLLPDDTYRRWPKLSVDTVGDLDVVRGWAVVAR